VAITIYLALFKGDLLLNEPTAPLSFDLFSAVVLIIAGPAIGFTLFVFQRTIYTIQSPLSRNQKKNDDRKKFVKNYAIVRIYCTPEEKSELEQNEAQLDFCISTGIALLVVDVYYILTNNKLDNIEVKISILIVGIILFTCGRLYVGDSYSALISRLFRIYKDKLT
jgi:hypothetical protein